MGLLFRWAIEDDIPSIKRFLYMCFGSASVQASPGRFDGLFPIHPSGFHVAICFSDDIVAGVRCFMPVKICVEDRVLDAAFPVDTMVAEQFRRRGIGQKFHEMAMERFNVVLANGPSPANSEIYRKNGAAVISGFKVGMQVRSPSIRGKLRPMIRDWLAWAMWVGRKRVDATLTSIDFLKAADLLPTMLPRFSRGEVGTIPDRDWFLWRYAGPYYNDYSLFLVESGALRGLLVTRKHGDIILIVDLVCSSESTAMLLNAVGHALPGSRVIVQFSGGRIERILRQAGFMIRPVDASLVVEVDDSALLNELKSLDWIIFGGDADNDMLSFRATS